MRTCIVDGRSGIVAARRNAPGTDNVNALFVLFDGDDVNESHAAWFLAADVDVTA